MTFYERLLLAATHAGVQPKQSAIAKALGIQRQKVNKWKKKGIPFEQQFRIQMKTKGRLKASMPDIRRV